MRLFIMDNSSGTLSCACERLTRLSGAAVNAYQSQYLMRLADAPGQHRCRVCGRLWQRLEEPTTKTATLVRLAEEGRG